MKYLAYLAWLLGSSLFAFGLGASQQAEMVSGSILAGASLIALSIAGAMK
ncbi:hypothetical protein [Pantoea sp. At-9b]|nr:hypothetical protein [Pantoea sp. At-9b]ADU71528.1 hypothetical protein Pat9b_5371 [Pantoea sp. At-9b]